MKKVTHSILFSSHQYMPHHILLSVGYICMYIYIYYGISIVETKLRNLISGFYREFLKSFTFIGRLMHSIV